MNLTFHKTIKGHEPYTLQEKKGMNPTLYKTIKGHEPYTFQYNTRA
jgi:hypothetical protein